MDFKSKFPNGTRWPKKPRTHVAHKNEAADFHHTRYGNPVQAVSDELERLVQVGELARVDYKGSASFRIVNPNGKVKRKRKSLKDGGGGTAKAAAAGGVEQQQQQQPPPLGPALQSALSLSKSLLEVKWDTFPPK